MIKEVFGIFCFFCCLVAFGDVIFAGDNLSNTNTIDLRVITHEAVSKRLAEMDDKGLSELVEKGQPLYSKAWGSSVKLEIDGVPVFVKKLPLNELEGSSENIRSTANLFEIPTYYQYGVGSAGFNAWRELETHLMSTQWVLKHENFNFPLMYHWRILTRSESPPDEDEAELRDYIKYWENSPAIENRIRANHNAPAFIVLFVEYIPETLHSWLMKQLAEGTLEQALPRVEQALKDTVSFMNAKGVLHFDAHAHNILTDGERFFLSDFGLATSSEFTLNAEELQFFQEHQNYDRCFVIYALTSWTISRVFGKDRFDEVLKKYASGEVPQSLPANVTPNISSFLKKHASLTLRMNAFFDGLKKETKLTPYPSDELDQLLQNPDSVKNTST